MCQVMEFFFTHLKTCFGTATHTFKLAKITTHICLICNENEYLQIINNSDFIELQTINYSRA